MDQPVATLFVYGTLRQGHARPMASWLARVGRRLGLATMPGRLVRVAWYPGLIDAPDPRDLREPADQAGGRIPPAPVHEAGSTPANRPRTRTRARRDPQQHRRDRTANRDAPRVYGDLFEIPDTPDVWRRLDAFEGCRPEDPTPHEYERVRRAVTPVFGQVQRPSAGAARPDAHATVDAWVYLYRGPLDATEPIPSGDFLNP